MTSPEYLSPLHINRLVRRRLVLVYVPHSETAAKMSAHSKKALIISTPSGFHMQRESPATILISTLRILMKFSDTLDRHSKHSDISIIEGNKGLYDGLDLDGSNSNAALAVLSNTPVILVIDSRGMTRGIAPLILGYQAFDPDIHIAGVILNNVGGSRHQSKLQNVIEHYTDVEVVGAVHNNPKLHLPERHLGLKPGNEYSEVEKIINEIGQIVASQVDLDKIMEIAGSADDINQQVSQLSLSRMTKNTSYRYRS